MLGEACRILFGSFCHQDPSILMVVDGRLLELCPRCVGLHVGFLVAKNGRVFFVHASYGTPAEVVRENALSSPILFSSRLRVVGKISADRNLILKWLKGERFVTRRWKGRRR